MRVVERAASPRLDEVIHRWISGSLCPNKEGVGGSCMSMTYRGKGGAED